MEVIRGRPLPPAVSDAERAAIVHGVETLVDGALGAARGEDLEYRTLRSWWRGTSIEAAFRKSHQAEAELARLYSDYEVAAEEWPAMARVVGLLGLLGGSLSAAVSIRNLRGTATPYDVPIALALLKVPAGALTALGALIAIRGEVIPGLSALDSQEQILAYALVFGYAQQLLTGLIDRQALGLLSAVPSKDAAQDRPQLSAAIPAAQNATP
jgi:hypothetical protein